MYKHSIFILGIVSLIGCQKEEQDRLPDITSTGANTAGANINGKVLVASNIYAGSSVLPAVYGGYAYDQQIHVTLFGRLSEQVVHIDLFVTQATQPGTYFFDQPTPRMPEALPDQVQNNYATFIYNKSGRTYATDATHTGQVVITHGERGAKNGIAGTFSFTAANVDDPADVLRIEQGRFDIAAQ
ncbi:DUF6252 family protein [Hymenobacter defluvii]|uniref:Uncharacterized protein n=1 Tax=Hymenobacter defluvii TaxID=2054411 RepID=A0ABS3TF91_9BACT|nr:DUF6252 family protein [Hymenobacter defluvii]MBO3272332.1 hypothetical protein [Hymenobacter defluvii]